MEPNEAVVQSIFPSSLRPGECRAQGLAPANAREEMPQSLARRLRFATAFRGRPLRVCARHGMEPSVAVCGEVSRCNVRLRAMLGCVFHDGLDFVVQNHSDRAHLVGAARRSAAPCHGDGTGQVSR